MTKTEKRLWLLALRALAILVYHRLHVPEQDMTKAGNTLSRDITEALVQLSKELDK